MHVGHLGAALVLMESNLCQVSQIDEGEECAPVAVEVVVQPYRRENCEPIGFVATAAGGVGRACDGSGKSVQVQQSVTVFLVSPIRYGQRELVQRRCNVLRLLGRGKSRDQGKILLHGRGYGEIDIDVLRQREKVCDQEIVGTLLGSRPGTGYIPHDLDDPSPLGGHDLIALLDIRKTYTPYRCQVFNNLQRKVHFVLLRKRTVL